MARASSSYAANHFEEHWAKATKAIHAGQAPDPTTGATIPPLYLTSTYTQPSPGQPISHEYSRTQNPTKEKLETCLAALDGGEDAAVFASGLAATTAVLHSLRPGDAVVAGHDLYGGTYRLLTEIFEPWGLKVLFTEDGSAEAYGKAIAEAGDALKLVWMETPTNPMLDVTDIEAVVAMGKDAGAMIAVDNTFASPVIQSPLALGADLVVYSSTKYLGGHSDVVGGALVAKDPATLGTHADRGPRFYQNAAGPQAGPFDAWLVQRGIKTLDVRMQRHCDNAEALADALVDLVGADNVVYPGLPSHPGHEIASRQMRRFGGMVSFKLPDMAAATTVATSLKVFSLAESLGGVESLCCHPASMTHGSIPKEIREARGVNDGLLRLSVGIENVDDIIEDVTNAVKKL